MINKIQGIIHALLVFLTLRAPTVEPWPTVRPWSERTAEQISDWEWQYALSRMADRMDRWHTAAAAGARLPRHAAA